MNVVMRNLGNARLARKALLDHPQLLGRCHRRRRSGAPSHQLISRTPCPTIEKYRTAGVDMLFVLPAAEQGLAVT